MNLSAEQFSEIVCSLDRAKIGGKSDQRRSSRAVQRRPILIVPIVDGDRKSPVNVTMLDFSNRGLGLLHNQPMARGEQFITRLTRGIKPPVEILCTVAHSRPMTGGIHKIGAEFTCILPTPAPQTPAKDGAEIDRIRQSMLT